MTPGSAPLHAAVTSSPLVRPCSGPPRESRMRNIIRWYTTVFAIAFVVIASAHLLRARPMNFALSEALLWASISAAIYVATRIYNSRQGRTCAVCEEPSPRIGQG